MSRKMRIGLLGFGTVGAGVYELIQGRKDMTVAKVLLRRPMQLQNTAVTQNIEYILQDESIDTVVEAIGGLHPAYEYVKAAMEAGKNVVTANKALVAAYYGELLSLAEKNGVLLRCTAAVGGGLGWLSELERLRRLEPVNRVGGIMNGTCNYILHAMDSRALSYGAALAQAQALGYAEADPSADVDGIDTRNKLVISGNVAFGVQLDAAGIPAAGIRHITKADVDNFKAHGLVCKLVSAAKADGGVYSAWVQPVLYPKDSLEAQVPENYNLTTLCGAVSGPKSFYGQGAGRYPTASNVVQDCLDILQGRGFYCPCGPKVPVCNREKLRYYVRAAEAEWPDDCVCAHWDAAVITEPVELGRMHSWLAEHPGAFAAAISEDYQ